MRFIRYSFLYWESLICSALLFAASVILLIISAELVYLLSVCALIAGAVVAWYCFNLNQEQIMICDAGILCEKKKKQIWMLKWEDIESVKKGSIYRNPGVTFVFKEDAQQRLLSKHSVLWYGFQLTPSAKKVLASYHFPVE